MGSALPAVAAGMVALAVSAAGVGIAVAQLGPKPTPAQIATMSPEQAAVPRAGALIGARAALPALDDPSSVTRPSGDAGTGEPLELIHFFAGGTVAIEVSAAGVWSPWSVPGPGFKIEVGSVGPDEVRVSFARGSHESRIWARMLPGRVEIELDEAGS